MLWDLLIEGPLHQLISTNQGIKVEFKGMPIKLGLLLIWPKTCISNNIKNFIHLILIIRTHYFTLFVL